MTPSRSLFRLVATLYLSVTIVAAFSNPSIIRSTTTSSPAVSPPSALKAGINTYLEDTNFNAFLKDNHDNLVLVDACAQWCGPCKLIDPFLQKSQQQYKKDGLEVVKFDVEADGTSGVKMEFLMQGVLPQALPHLILFHNGKAVGVHTGVLKQDQLNAFIEERLQLVKTSRKKAEIKRKERELAEAGTSQKVGKGLISFGGSGYDEYALSGAF